MTFALDGGTYEIDLGTKNAAALCKALAVYIEAARPIRNRRGKKVTRSTIGADARTVKEWARANGYEVNDRGRVPADIRTAFEAANCTRRSVQIEVHRARHVPGDTIVRRSLPVPTAGNGLGM